jgi:hypothetical protein
MYDALFLINGIALVLVAYGNLKQAKRIQELEDYLFGDSSEHAEGGTD